MSSLRESGVVGDSAIHRLDPRAKLVGLLAVTVIAVSSAAWPVHAACAVALLLVAAAARIGPRVIVRRARLILLPVLLVALFARTAFPPVAAKATIGTVSAVLLGATTSFPDVLHALERLKVPRLLVLIAAFMYRYLFTIVDEVQRMRAALTARGYAPRHALQVQAIGRVATALFLRTYERAERVHLAMLARGFDERMPRLHAPAFRRADALFLTALAPLLAVRVVA
ncbi:energy-coupling factor transporter transmembrane protein EcfT [Solirubrobacter phytolaccae]|uniref:Energy-coupling factor transporter transmembrane protein EcfT n=1 Tax=Solirubrobacter phytolaccae TaxID=1404360 RepID=A0A9X3N5T8_9ACTN|nr:energy-coupling factor transporter transmembrane component T [Solirubrobacter phytolaccae]MDA0178867.1 energy-coupling factor transporter transmembrane protein EcfT [Solirubrobacter phytolaccae]